MTMKGSSVTRRLAVSAAVFAIGMLLSACGSNSEAMPAGAASVVGTQTVTESQVSDTVNEVLAQIALDKAAKVPTEGAVTLAVVQRSTQHLLFGEAASREGIVITQSQIDDFIASYVTQQFKGDRKALDSALASGNFVPSSQVNDAASDQLVYGALLKKIAPQAASQADVATAVKGYFEPLSKELNVRVAPRYGTWTGFTLGPVANDLASSPGTGSTAVPSAISSP